MAISTFMGLQIGMRGVQTSRTSLDVTAHNIANANTEGYTRQRADLVSDTPFTTPSLQAMAYAGQLGTGVTVSQVERIRMDFFDIRVQNEKEKFARYDALYSNLQQVELLMNEPSDNGLRSVLDTFWQSLEDLSNDPETPATRSVVVENGVALSNAFTQIYDELDALKENINDEVIQRVDELNIMVEEIASLNQQISEVKNIGNNPNDLLDRRDLLLDNLSELVNISTTYKGTDQELVVTVNGRPIIQGHEFSKLKAVENRDNGDMVDVIWEKDFIPQSSDEDVLTVFTNSSAPNQSHTVTVKQLARKNLIMGSNSLPFEERTLNSEGNGSNFTSGYFTINGKNIYVDPETDTLNDVVGYINDAGLGIKATLSDNKIIMESNDSGIDNQIEMNSGTSNFLRVMGLVNSLEGTTEYIEKDQALNIPVGDFNINGTLITVDPSDSLNDIVENINKSDSNVKAMIEETDSGNYKLLIEGTNGDYNIDIDDNGNPAPNVLDELGISYGTEIPAPGFGDGTVDQGYILGDTAIEDITDRGLGLGQASVFEIEDPFGNIATINIDSTNDSLEQITDIINTELNAAGINGEAEMLKDPEGNYRLFINSLDANPIAIRSVSGNILNNLGVKDGTYAQNGPLNFKAKNSIFNLDGSDMQYSSNIIDGVIPDIKFTIRGLGQSNIEIRKVLSGGKLKGLLESRDEVVASYMKDMDKLAYSLIQEMNDAHYEGFGSDGNTQRVFFEVFNGNIDGYKEVGAARSLRVSRDIQLDVTKLAAAGRDSENQTSDGLPVSLGIGSGDNALDMAKLKFALTMEGGTATFNEFFNMTISEIGTQASEAGRIQQNQELLLEKIDSVREQVSGVSLDEEMTNMVKFQHAYTAAAKVITTMDKMIEVVINMAG